MPNKNSLLDKARMPYGKVAKKKLDNWLNENVNLPLAERGHEDTAALLSAVLSAGGELLIPDDLADVAMAVVPGLRLAKVAKKGLKALKKVDKVKGLKPVAMLDYGKIKQAEKLKADKIRQASEKGADTLVYEQGGKKITRKKPKVDIPEDGLIEILD